MQLFSQRSYNNLQNSNRSTPAIPLSINLGFLHWKTKSSMSDNSIDSITNIRIVFNEPTLSGTAMIGKHYSGRVVRLHDHVCCQRVAQPHTLALKTLVLNGVGQLFSMKATTVKTIIITRPSLEYFSNTQCKQYLTDYGRGNGMYKMEIPSVKSEYISIITIVDSYIVCWCSFVIYENTSILLHPIRTYQYRAASNHKS